MDRGGKENGRILGKRYIFLCIGLIIMAFGVAFSIKGGLGTSPVSSVPYVVSCFTPLTVGNVTIIINSFFLLLQIIILRKDFDPVQLMQLPVAFLFGFLTDFALFAIQNIPCETYLHQWICCILGIVLGGTGISFEVAANVITLAGEGLVLAICKVVPIPFGNAKVLFDVFHVCVAVALSLIFIGMVAGVREGTIAAALFVGFTAKKTGPLLEKLAAKFFV